MQGRNLKLLWHVAENGRIWRKCCPSPLRQWDGEDFFKIVGLEMHISAHSPALWWTSNIQKSSSKNFVKKYFLLSWCIPGEPIWGLNRWQSLWQHVLEKSTVLRRRLNSSMSVIWWSSSGRLFHAAAKAAVSELGSCARLHVGWLIE